MAYYITRRAISKWAFAKIYSNGFGSGSCTEFVKKVGWAINAYKEDLAKFG
jgi:hypothetical protein